MGRTNPLSTRLIAGIASAWGILVWADWLKFNPVEPAAVARAIAAYGRIDPASAVGALSGHALLGLLVAFLALAAFGLGRPVLSLTGREPPGRRGFTAFLLGAGAASLQVLGAGFCGLAHPNLTWAFAAPWAVAGAGALAPSLARGLSSWREHARALSPWWLSAPIAVGLLIALIGALVPPCAYDTIFHHLAHPSIWADRHKVVLLPYHFLSYYPAIVEMQYLAVLLAGGGTGAGKLVHFGWGVFTFAAVMAWARARMEGSWALAACAGLVLIPYVQLTMMWGYVDLGTAAYVTVIVWALASPPVSPIVLGTLAGVAAGTKAAGVFAFVLASAVLIARRKSRKHWIAFGLSFLAFACPWGVRNWLASGNPFAPFLAGTIPTLFFGADNIARYHAELTSYQRPGNSGLLSLLASPWNASVRNLGVLDQGGGMSAWFLFALPLLLLLPGAGGRVPALLCGGFFLLWLAIPRQVRYLLPIWPACALACAYSLRAFSRKGGLALLPVGLAAVMLVVHFLAAFQRQRQTLDPVPVALGTETPEEYLERGIGGKPYSVRAGKWLNENLKRKRFLVVSDYGMGMLWGEGAVFQSAFDTPLIERFSRESSGPERIAVKFRQIGVGYVLYGTEGGFPMQEEYRIYNFDPGSAARWRAFWAGHASLAFSQNDRYHLYRLGPRKSGPGAVSVLPGLDEQRLAAADGELRRARESADADARLEELARDYLRIADESASPAAFERLGLTYLHLNRDAEAARAFSRAVELGRDSARLRYALGMLDYRKAEFGRAAGELRLSLKRDPDLDDSRRLLARILLDLGRPAEAAVVIREGLERDPGNEELAQMLRNAAGGGP